MPRFDRLVDPDRYEARRQAVIFRLQNTPKPFDFDAQDAEWLMSFWHLSAMQPMTIVRAMGEPGSDAPRRATVESLGAYACARACAKDLTQSGDEERAAVYEQHCAIYYDQLPSAVRWK